MKHNMLIAAAVLAMVGASCNARSGSANKVTVAGCVQSAEQGLGSADKKDIDRFMLTDANLISTGDAAASPRATDQTGSDRSRGDRATADRGANTQPRNDAAPEPAPAPTAAMYMLDGKTSDLRDQLNHRVEITGRLDRANDRDSDRAASSSTSTASDRRQELHVDSVRMIAANCNP